MNSKLLQHFIEQQGWSLYGVVDYETLKSGLQKHEGIFKEWIDKGFQADMDYLEEMAEDRYHPHNKLPDLKSIVVLGAWYDSDSGPVVGRSWADGGINMSTSGSQSAHNRGVVARYARGKDYHKVIKKKLIELSDWLKSKNPLAQTYVSVDSGPMVDRVLAEAAGLGFFGKNTCLINPSKGSYFFIASLLTNLDLTSTAKKPMPNCGSCTRCIDKCPTGALKGPGVIDANLCISYLTIENKGGIPLELRPKIGNRLFGCDICQEVCPFNMGRAHKQEVRIDKLKGEYGVGETLDLREILSLRTDDEFLKRFAGTPLMRPKRRGLLRNACVVAGNSGDKTLIPYLKKVLSEEDDKMLKEHAQWAIDCLESDKRVIIKKKFRKSSVSPLKNK